ncbi:hemerythrin domain-containing protein [Sporosarcina newyorkensis]|uniref:Hemerythrin HHE cation binding domain-containing protein n=1 Tax=Sporosarcina newyorkensis TaxID=759851 RepID=A0A1T4XPL4_9BACL|nr:hemerythrin domain-containing protein [Sporosarcina newyorkensis]SKA91457.1 Hemerythrin HHE cation binding domain-containing protein [Sporosarcina newyorkensis]
MSGPALRQLHSHRAIHEGGLSGAVMKTEDLVGFLEQGEQEMVNQACDDLIDYWKTRVISHADAEEEGFYKQILAENPELEREIIQLTRDHDLMRLVVQDIEALREKDPQVTAEIMQKFYGLMVINELHSREEERLLFQ